MTLHEAIEFVLRKYKKPLKSSEIAQLVNTEKLYTREDNQKISSNQIYARVIKYPELFDADPEGISLRDLSIKPYKDFLLRITAILHKITPASSLQNQEITASLLTLIYNNTSEIQLIVEADVNKKKSLIFALKKLESNNWELVGKLKTTIEFITNSLSEYDVERIIGLIDSYNFIALPRPSIDEFSLFFNDAINAFNWKNNFRSGESSTPKLITSLISSLYELPFNSRVFDPFAGRANILNELVTKNKNIKEIIAGDLMESSVTIGSLNLYATGLREFIYNKQNAFIDWPKNINADLVVSNPPMAGKMDNISFLYNWQLFPTSDITLNAVQLCLHHINATGKAIIVVPESVLFGSNNAAIAIRTKLLNEDLLQGVILLPKNIFKPYATIVTALLLIDKTAISKSSGVFMYDSSNVPLNEFKKEIEIISSTFHSEASIPNKAKWVHKSEFEKEGYDLSVKRYLLQSLRGEEYTSLKSMLTESFVGYHISKSQLNKNDGLPYVQIGDLIEGEGLGIIEKSKLKSFISHTQILSSSSVKEIPYGSILISKIGTKLKPTLFDQQFIAVASSNIIVLKPKSGILPEYLIAQLQSEYVQNQIEAIRKYSAAPNFNLKDLLNVQIKNVSIEQQQQYVTTYYSRKLSNVEKAEGRIKEDELYNIISRIKHEVKQSISSIGIDISILSDYLKLKEEHKEAISMDDYALEPLTGQKSTDLEGSKIKNILPRIKRSVDDAQETLHYAEVTLNIGKSNLKIETIEIKEFIESTIMPIYLNSNCTIKTKGKGFMIRADKYQLKVLFKHLMENALKHGFVLNRTKEENKIEIIFDEEPENDFNKIVVRNNGKPFSPNFNRSLFETRGLTSNRDKGSGFGGYHIKRIIENHQGHFFIADDTDTMFSEFKVQFEISIPKIYE